MLTQSVSREHMVVVKDSDCRVDTPVRRGRPDKPIYGKGVAIKPFYDGKADTKYERRIHLHALLPLEEYDLIVVLFSAGKDSAAAYYKLLELGVPKSKIELWHHDIDGGHPSRRMDWPCTGNYVQAFAKAEGVQLRVSWRVNGFWGEVYRIGSSYPVEYVDQGQLVQCQLTDKQIKSDELRQKILQHETAEELETLKGFGHRMMFPAKSGDLARRWCSSSLKIDVADRVIRDLTNLKEIGMRRKLPAKSGCHQGRWCSGTLKAGVQGTVVANLEKLKANIKVLFVSGERRGESSGRAGYNEIEMHRTNATAKAHRLVHQWRAVIDYSERDIWEVLRRHRLNPHPCYRCGWNRCSCMMCIFSLPKHWAGIRELFPQDYEAFCKDEILLGFTLDNNKALPDFVGEAQSCVYRGDKKALRQLVTGQYTTDDIYVNNWQFPAGAFKGAEGGPC